MLKENNKKTKGFSLIELLVVLAIIVILAALVLVNINQARMRGRDAKRVADVSSIELAFGLYNDANKTYPEKLKYDDEDNPLPDRWATDGSSSPLVKANWDQLSGELEPYILPLPKDPLNKPGYRIYVYIYHEDGISTGAMIKTKLESESNFEKMSNDSCSNDPNPAITNNPDFYDIIIGYAPFKQKAVTCKDFESINYF